MQKAICDKCEKPFFISKTRKKFFKDDKQDTVIIHYFDCPYCKAKYPFHAETDEIKKLIKKQKNLATKINGSLSVEHLNKIYKQIDELKNKVKSLQAEYKAFFKLDK